MYCKIRIEQLGGGQSQSPTSLEIEQLGRGQSGQSLTFTNTNPAPPPLALPIHNSQAESGEVVQTNAAGATLG